METAGYVTIALFMAGVIFQAGRMSARIDELERWRADMKRDLDRVFEQLRTISAALGVAHEE